MKFVITIFKNSKYTICQRLRVHCVHVGKETEKYRETVFACSYQGQIVFFNEKGRKICDTVHLTN